MYRQTSNKRRALIGNKIVDHSDAVGIRLEGPEDPHLRKSSFGGHVTALTLQYLWPRPPGVWLGGPGCKPGHSGRL